MNSQHTLKIIGVALDAGAPQPGTAQGPNRLFRLGLAHRLRRRGLQVTSPILLAPAPGQPPLAAVAECCLALARETAAAVESRQRFLVLGGDHSCAAGTWSGAASAIRNRGPMGLIWIDAHLDCHTPASSPSGALHGMPLACLLGYGDAVLTGLSGMGPALSPGHVSIVGPHSYEEGERELAERLGVRVFYLDEVVRRGLDAVMDEALSLARDGTAGFGVTLDLDAIDARVAPGVSVPVEPGGLGAEELIDALSDLARLPDFIGLEITELSPPRDRNRVTAYLAMDLALAALTPEPVPQNAEGLIETARRYGAANYDSLPVVLARGEGAHVWDTAGRRYLDMMGAYSAASHGHAHPRLVRALERQARRLSITSRAFHNDQLGPFLARLCELSGQDRALPMNTGAEAVETALKAARRWAYRVKGMPAGQANIIVCDNNFHGRTITIVGFSSEAKYRDGFGPFPAGFRAVPFGDALALAAAIDEHTAAFLVEPIQGEGGIVVPPEGYLAECARICRERKVLLICDEIQTGLGRTGRRFASDHDGVKPDGLILGKALGGGLIPVSAFLARDEVMGVFTPGSHGSTFGGNPLAAAVGLEALEVLEDEDLAGNSAVLGGLLLERLRALESPAIRAIRGRGLFVGVELQAPLSGRQACLRLLEKGILTRETRASVIRLAPPLVVEAEDLESAVALLGNVLAEMFDQSGGFSAPPAEGV